MPVKPYKPTSAGRRLSSVQSFLDVTETTPYGPLVQSQKQYAGRANNGKIAVRHRGGGAKRHIRIIDWKQNKFDIPAVIQTIEYDPNRGARIALVAYEDGEKRYMLAPDGARVGMRMVTSREKGDPAPGNRFPIEKIPIGIALYNIELQPGRGGQLARGAGTSALLVAVEGDRATLKLPSGEVRTVHKSCMASIGIVSNADWRLVRWGKAGRMRHRSIRPTVRGKAMNPVDHPHGGGEGRNSIGLHFAKTPTGKHAHGVKTRRRVHTNAFILRRRRGGTL